MQCIVLDIRDLNCFLAVSVQCLLRRNLNWVLRQRCFFLEILLGTCCSVVPDCSSLTSRASLFVVILLLLSDPDELGCSTLFSSALSSLIATSSPMSSLLLARVTSCVGPALTSLITSPVPVFWSALVMTLVCTPDADFPLLETEGRGVEYCSVSSAIFL